MATQDALEAKIVEEMAKFLKTMEELRMLNNVSKDLRRYKKLITFKKFD